MDSLKREIDQLEKDMNEMTERWKKQGDLKMDTQVKSELDQLKGRIEAHEYAIHRVLGTRTDGEYNARARQNAANVPSDIEVIKSLQMQLQSRLHQLEEKFRSIIYMQWILFCSVFATLLLVLAMVSY